MSFLASDASPIIEYTDKVVYLEDGSIAVMRKGEDLKVVNIFNRELFPKIQTVDLDLGQIEKGGYPHFMLKEIFEQPECLTNCMRGRVNVEATNVTLSAVIDYKNSCFQPKDNNRWLWNVMACRINWKQIIESLCRIPVEVEYASEFRYRNPVVTDKDIVVAISQSGETADTLAAVRLAKQCGAFIYGICNVIGASIPRATDTGSYIHVGPEIGVASTKAFTGQVTVLTMLALALAKERGTVDDDTYFSIVRELSVIPQKCRKLLS